MFSIWIKTQTIRRQIDAWFSEEYEICLCGCQEVCRREQMLALSTLPLAENMIDEPETRIFVSSDNAYTKQMRWRSDHQPSVSVMSDLAPCPSCSCYLFHNSTFAIEHVFTMIEPISLLWNRFGRLARDGELISRTNDDKEMEWVWFHSFRWCASREMREKYREDNEQKWEGVQRWSTLRNNNATFI